MPSPRNRLPRSERARRCRHATCVRIDADLLARARRHCGDVRCRAFLRRCKSSRRACRENGAYESRGHFPRRRAGRAACRDRLAYLVKPTGKVDSKRRWLWEFPFWLGINDGFGNLQHRDYVEKALAAGFHIAGVEIGVSCASPAAAEVCQEFYNKLIADYHLDKRARIMGQSHGGLDGLRLGLSPSRVRRAHRRHLSRH